MLTGGKDSQIWITCPISNVNFFYIEKNLRYQAQYWVAKTNRFENQAWYPRFFLRYPIKSILYQRFMMTILNKISISGTISGMMSGKCIVLTSDANGRTGSCRAPSRRPKPRQWLGGWTPNGWGWTSWFCWSRAFTIPYTLIIPNIVFYIIPYIWLSHCNSDKRHSLTATVINDLITTIPYFLPRSRFFTTDVSIFTSLARAQNRWTSSTPARSRADVATFLW